MNRYWITAAMLLAGAHAASAHAFLESATPAVGSTVRQAPSRVAIAFTEGVEPLFSTIVVTDGAGRHVESGAVRRAGDARHLAIGLLALAPGTYRVTWHAVSLDTHKTQGSYLFTLAPP